MTDPIRTKRQTSYPLLSSVNEAERLLVTRGGLTYNLPISLMATAEQLAAKMEVVGEPSLGDVPVFDGENWVPGQGASESGPYGDFQIAEGEEYTPDLSAWIDITEFFSTNLAEGLTNTDGIFISDELFWRLRLAFNINLEVNNGSAVIEFRMVHNGYAVPGAVCRVKCAEGAEASGAFINMIEAGPDEDIRIIMYVIPDDPGEDYLTLTFNSGSISIDSRSMVQPEPEEYPSFIDEEGYVFIDEEEYELIDAEI